MQATWNYVRVNTALGRGIVEWKPCGRNEFHVHETKTSVARVEWVRESDGKGSWMDEC